MRFRGSAWWAPRCDSRLSVYAAALSLAASLFAQPLSKPARREDSSRSTFRTGAQLVLIPVNVRDRRGANLSGLTQENFSVWEGKTSQPIVSFGSQDAPSSVGIVLDTSGSMRWPLTAAKEVVTAFLKEANADDEFFLVTVSSQPEIQTTLTDRPEIVEAALRSAKARGNT